MTELWNTGPASSATHQQVGASRPKAGRSQVSEPNPGDTCAADLAKFSRPANQSELAILRHPDQQTTWTVVAVAHLEPLSNSDPGGALEELVARRLKDLATGLPIVSCRLDGERWIPGDNPLPAIAQNQQTTPEAMLERFDLANEPPLRLLLDRDGRWISFFVHHAALDGARLLIAMKILLCGIDPPEPAPDLPSKAKIPWPVLARLLLPASPIAPSKLKPSRDSFVSRSLPIMGAGVRTKLPQACLDAACSFSEKMGRPCKRIGLSLGIAPTHGPVNHSTYRRIDARFGAPLSQSIEAALAAPEDPWEIRHSTKMLKLFSHVAPRLSDTVILTNLGRQHMPGITRLEGFPVARGRSAVAYGAIRLAGGDSTITLRARDIDLDDANAIIDDVIARIAFNL